MRKSAFFIARVGLSGQENVLSSLTQSFPVIRFATVISLGGVEVVYPQINGPIDQLIRILLTTMRPQDTLAAKAKDCHINISFAESPFRYHTSIIVLNLHDENMSDSLCVQKILCCKFLHVPGDSCHLRQNPSARLQKNDPATCVYCETKRSLHKNRSRQEHCYLP